VAKNVIITGLDISVFEVKKEWRKTADIKI